MSNSLDPNQTVCKGYQQITLAGKYFNLNLFFLLNEKEKKSAKKISLYIKKNANGLPV